MSEKPPRRTDDLTTTFAVRIPTNIIRMIDARPGSNASVIKSFIYQGLGLDESSVRAMHDAAKKQHRQQQKAARSSSLAA